MALAITNYKGWSVDHPYETFDFTLSGGDAGFVFSPSVTNDQVDVYDSLLGRAPLHSKASGVVTVTGCTANGTGTVLVSGSPL